MPRPSIYYVLNDATAECNISFALVGGNDVIDQRSEHVTTRTWGAETRVAALQALELLQQPGTDAVLAEGEVLDTGSALNAYI
jgi:hypothetical protein